MTGDPSDDWEDDYDQFSQLEREEDCDHAEADIDIMTGRLSCRCGLQRAAAHAVWRKMMEPV